MIGGKDAEVGGPIDPTVDGKGKSRPFAPTRATVRDVDGVTEALRPKVVWVMLTLGSK